MAGGPEVPVSPTLPFQGGVVDDMETAKNSEEGGAGGGGSSSSRNNRGGAQEAWEAFNRMMDERDKSVEEAAAAVAAAAAASTAMARSSGSGGGVGGGSGVGKGSYSSSQQQLRELPPAMLEVLKVTLSLLRRLSSRNLIVTGPFASSMPLWPSGHPQVCFIHQDQRGGRAVEVCLGKRGRDKVVNHMARTLMHGLCCMKIIGKGEVGSG